MIKSATAALPPWIVALGAIFSVQLSAALSVHLIASVGPAGTAWLRLTAGALIFLALARPPLREIRRRDVPGLLALGVTSGLMGVAILGAIERIPLGTAVAIGFLGPLTVAAVRSDNRAAMVWPAAAVVGVVLLTEPWKGAINGVGVAFAAIAGMAWGAYILLTQRVGDRFSGIKGLTLTVPIAAVTTAFVGIPQASGHFTIGVVATAVGLALLFPVVTFALEMAALRRMTHTAFGTLMALEPAVGVVLGLLVLHQKPSIIQIAGVLLVVLAGAAAQYGGRRRHPVRDSNHEDPQPTTIPPS